MSDTPNGGWNSANGRLPFRPPTVDEALPYSPFTSVIPFSPDIIPFPSAEPPPPPTTLTPEQQNAANAAVRRLNEDVEGSTISQQLETTLQKLQNLLRPEGLSQFQFKPVQQLPPASAGESTAAQSNGSTSQGQHLSPFASMLLDRTDVEYMRPGRQSSARQNKRRTSGGQATPQSSSRPTSHSQNSNAPHPGPPAASQHQLLPSASKSRGPTIRSGSAVLVPALPPGARPEDYRRFDSLPAHGTPAKKKERSDGGQGAPVLKTREREISQQKINELYSLVQNMSAEKGFEDSRFFQSLDTDEGTLQILGDTALSELSDAVSSVVNSGSFPIVDTSIVLRLQSLCEPLITATGQMSTDFAYMDGADFRPSVSRLQSGLKAARLVLQTMTEGSGDRRICSEDLIQRVVLLQKRILQSCITPIAESRRNNDQSALFALVSEHKSALFSVLRLCGDLSGRIASLIGKIRLSDMTLNAIESVCIDIVFSQNADKDADSAFGIQRFETFRQKAMDVVAQIFACHQEQRNSILVEILSNLERLPDKRASARQYKSAREAPIMLVSALFMRIVQAAANLSSEENKGVIPGTDSDDGSDGAMNGHGKAGLLKGQSPNHIAQKRANSAKTTAANIATILVSRAENVSKSGDKPFRNLLDLFVEDLCNVFGSPEWPAASILLESLLIIMVKTLDSIKEKGVQAADMALSTLATMGAGIMDFRARMRQVKRGLDITQSDLASKLVPMVDDALANNINSKDIIAPNGPYHIVLEGLSAYLLGPHRAHAQNDEPQLRSVSEFYATFWASSFYKAFDEGAEEYHKLAFVVELEKHVRNILLDSHWLSKEYSFRDVSDSECRLAAGIIASQQDFCRYLPNLVSHLIKNTRNQSSKVKSRAMASLTQLIDKDPNILDDRTFPILAGLVGDSSPMVRENTLSLIAKGLEKNPSIKKYCLPMIHNLTTDPANGPKKRAIKLLKDIYLMTEDRDERVTVSVALLLPVVDDDKTIAELTRQALEEVWLAPLRPSSKTSENHQKLARETRLQILIATVQRVQSRPSYLAALETFFRSLLGRTSKNAAENFAICRELVADMIEGVIGTDATAAEKAQARILQTLSIFAKVKPKLFTAEQVQLLKLYVKHLASAADLEVFQPTVIILRYVFPALSGLQDAFLEEVRDSLSRSTSKLALWAVKGNAECKRTLLDVAHCLWIISPLVKGGPGLKSGIEKLVTTVSSVVVQLEPLSIVPTQSPHQNTLAYLVLLGTFGKVCDFDKDINLFQGALAQAVQQRLQKGASQDQLRRLIAWKSTSVAALLLEIVLPFTRQAWDISVRQQALCSLGEICQQKTKLFTRADIEKAFKLPFLNADARLIRVVLTQFKDFLETAERRSESGAEIAVGEGAVHGAERLETSFTASDNDHATTHIARAFLQNIIETALGKDLGLALPATDILVSISRQGLLHPKECGAALVALSTSGHTPVAFKSSAEHLKIHLQHETMFEKEYMAAVNLAFKYQGEVFGDVRGALDTNFRPKMQLLFDALKQGSRKVLKKFCVNLLAQVDFELAELDTSETIPRPVLFARFCLENCALFDYERVDEVMNVIVSIEEIVLKHAGPAVALAIETEMPQQPANMPSATGNDGAHPDVMSGAPGTLSVPEERLRKLSSAALILHMMWEARAFLRRVFNLQGKITAKDMLKPATRMNFISGKELYDKYTTMLSALDNVDAMRKECYEFAEMINVDREHQVEDDDVSKLPVDYDTPDENERDAPVPTSGKGRKRKSSAGLGPNTPKRQRHKSSVGRSKAKRSSKTPDDSD
ncbi:hypothetical protein M011DRAFT_467291 [Sporormia fimetaria CBS 119925]|uniref:Sister chromatid cohesion protein n=1 Tax=Sporormia fimetaria CBS 119925 TaxID=1340428 RepID=A0A6A6VDQ0_9PLEO|nr:hypothetical protein M011DRAFT_467291 [Sporormia fimetaria CBS 119925]